MHETVREIKKIFGHYQSKAPGYSVFVDGNFIIFQEGHISYTIEIEKRQRYRDNELVYVEVSDVKVSTPQKIHRHVLKEDDKKRLEGIKKKVLK